MDSAEQARELRAAVARDGRKLYEIAPLIPMHPNTLGQLLRGRRPIRADVADRVLKVLEPVASR
jgi:plasmid maintenance system antidote protein VapI